jgi:poly(beta-D-mannuronate) lyase
VQSWKKAARAASILAVLCITPPLLATEYRLSPSQIAAPLATLKPGDTVIKANGEWKDQQVFFKAHGTAKKPITLRAETPGKAILTGKSTITVSGDYLVLSGFLLRDGGGVSNGIMVSGNHCRITETSVVGGTYKFFIHLAGSENRMDHCYVAEKTSESPTVQVEVESRPNHHQIDHNYFGHRPPLGRNGGETMRVGYSWQSMSNSATVVEENLFERCDGEIEIISSKSCENIYRNNTFLDCAGMLTLRHGNRCVVENNFFLAHHKRGSGGIRVIGENHRIINNYIDGVYQGAIWITAGIVNSPLKGYFQAKNELIASNTFVDCRGPCLDLDAGYGTSQRTLHPQNITIANNAFSIPENGEMIRGTQGEGFKWNGNIAAVNTAGAVKIIPAVQKQTGVKLMKLDAERGTDGLWKPKSSAEAPIRAGCDPSRHPLTRAEVGPSWLQSAGIVASGK